MLHKVRLKSVLAGGVCALALATTAHAQPHSFNIPAGDLKAALDAYAAQTGVQLIYRPEEVRGLRSLGLRGSADDGAALQQILAGSNLSITRQTSGAVAVTRAGEARPQSGEPAAAAEPAQLSEVTVTGSNIHGVTPASPIQVFTRADLERSNQTTVADALRALPANFGGGASESFGTGGDKLSRNGGLGAGLNLRGLGNNATLVLLNGHRMAGSGTFADFQDISNIPSAAVERVEVLLDGASAVYGSDAVGGVVNIILRKDFDGAETAVLGGAATDGGRGQDQVSQTFGRRWAGGGFMVSYEYQRQDHLAAADRSFAATSDLRPLGGTDKRLTNAFPGNILIVDPVTKALVPGFGIPAGQSGIGLSPADFVAGRINRQNQRQGSDILPSQELNSLYVAGDQAVGPIELMGDLRLSRRSFRNLQIPAVSTLTIGRSNPFYVSPTGATTESISYSFVNDLPSPVQAGRSDSLATSLGAKTDLPGGWRSEAYAAFSQVTEENRGSGIVNSLILNEALGNTPDNPATAYSPAVNGYFNPFNGLPGGPNLALAPFIGSGFALSIDEDRVWSANIQADGPVLTLPGGVAKLAVGAEARREAFNRLNTVLVASTSPAINQQLDLSRDVLAAFAEARIPIFGPENARPGLQRLELSAAARVEHYQSFGTTTNPKLGLLWSPIDGLQVRATYGRSFRAPGLREVFEPEQFNPQMLAFGGGRILALTKSGGNRDLKPETAQSWTIGFDLRPASIPGLSLSATGFDIRFRNRIGQPVAVNLGNALQDPTLASFVTRISPTTSAADLALIKSLLASPALSNLNGTFPPETFGAIVENGYVNTASVRVRGVDASARYILDLGRDQLVLAGDATYMLAFDQQLTPGSPVVKLVNIMNFPERFRTRITADWTRGRVTVGGAFNYTSAYHDTLGVRIGDQPTYDLQARLAPADSGAMKGVAVTLSVRNLFDCAPPFYNNTVGIGYDAASGDPIGRFVSLQLTRAW